MAVSHIQPRAYEDVIEFLAAGSSPEDILQFRPSAKALRRVRSLLEKNGNGTLSPEEEAELAQYEHIEHLMRLVKARARQFVKSQSQKPSGEVTS